MDHKNIKRGRKPDAKMVSEAQQKGGLEKKTRQTNKELPIKMANSSPFLYYKACFGR
jgi:hypothetical protein